VFGTGFREKEQYVPGGIAKQLAIRKPRAQVPLSNNAEH